MDIFVLIVVGVVALILLILLLIYLSRRKDVRFPRLNEFSDRTGDTQSRLDSLRMGSEGMEELMRDGRLPGNVSTDAPPPPPPNVE